MNLEISYKTIFRFVGMLAISCLVVGIWHSTCVSTFGNATTISAYGSMTSSTTHETMGHRGAGFATMVSVCPFCSSINPTVAEQLETHDAVVVVKLTKLPPPADDDDYELPKATFEVVELLKGEAYIHSGATIEAVLIGQFELGGQFMLMGVDPPSMAWTTAIPTSDRVVEYFKKIPSLPPAGPDRLAYFQDFFEDEEVVLANDAYDEFALSSYADVIALKDRMKHDKIIEFISDENVLESRKRLYFTLLGVCGTESDVPFLESMLAEENREKRPGLDSMAACYLRIRGPEGLPFIEKLFLSNLNAEYIDVFSIIQALRFHTTECDIISKGRVAESMRLVLDHPKIADIVIPDLARLEDWSIVDRLAEMFRTAEGETKWVRTPIASYMFACPKPEAEKHLAEFRKLDPDAVNRAELMANFDLFDDLDLDDEMDDDGDEGDDNDESDDNDGELNEGKNDDDGGSLGSTVADSPVFVLTADSNVSEIYGSNGQENGLIAVSSLKPAYDPGQNGNLSGEINSDPQEHQRVATESKLDADDPLKEEHNHLATRTQNSGPLADSAIPTAHWSVIISGLLLVSLVLFMLAWSVINGWFERLIF